jgi:hypothetical protein
MRARAYRQRAGDSEIAHWAARSTSLAGNW